MPNIVHPAWLAVVVLLGGCRNLPQLGAPTLPAGSAPIPVQVRTYAESMWSLPVGAHRVEGTSYVILKQSHGPSFGALFGPLGVLAVHAAQQQPARGAADQRPVAFRLDLDATTRRILERSLVADDRLRVRDVTEAKGDVLGVTPYVWIGSCSTGQNRVHAIVEAELKDAGGERRWWNRYIHYSPETRPLTGEGGWVANDGAALESASRDGLEVAVAVLLDDLRGKLARTGPRGRHMGPYLGFPEPVALEGLRLAADPRGVLVESPLAWGGLHILPAREVPAASR